MEDDIEVQDPQNNPEDVVQISPAELAELRMKADASEQNFTRLKKLEVELKELKPLKEGESKEFDSASLEKRIEEKVDLRVAGHSSEEIAEIEAYAKGRGISLSEAAKSPFIAKAVEAFRAEKKSTDSTPAPTRVPTFNGKPVDEILKSGTPAEKQAAFEAKMKGGVKSE
jgi:hypothetical protein